MPGESIGKLVIIIYIDERRKAKSKKQKAKSKKQKAKSKKQNKKKKKNAITRNEGGK